MTQSMKTNSISPNLSQCNFDDSVAARLSLTIRVCFECKVKCSKQSTQSAAIDMPHHTSVILIAVGILMI